MLYEIIYRRGSEIAPINSIHPSGGLGGIIIYPIFQQPFYRYALQLIFWILIEMFQYPAASLINCWVLYSEYPLLSDALPQSIGPYVYTCSSQAINDSNTSYRGDFLRCYVASETRTRSWLHWRFNKFHSSTNRSCNISPVTIGNFRQTRPMLIFFIMLSSISHMKITAVF